MPQGATLLDAGCGYARDSKAFIELEFNVEAFDTSEVLANHAQSVIKKMLELLLLIAIPPINLLMGYGLLPHFFLFHLANLLTKSKV
jgi:hypothetical protein